jgi:hypothetical protein
MIYSAQKLEFLRAALKYKGIDTYIVPSTDPHLGEYTPDHWQIIRWLTGFTGSTATVVVTDNFAGLWTDSRYFIQAESNRSSGWLVNQCFRENFMDFICENAGRDMKLALTASISTANSRLEKGKDKRYQFTRIVILSPAYGTIVRSACLSLLSPCDFPARKICQDQRYKGSR